MKARKKPVVIDFIQLREDNIRDVVEFIEGKQYLPIGSISWHKFEEYKDIVRRDGYRIKTLESDNETQIADIGDIIIKGVKGEFYPCKPEIFYITYEIIED